MTPQEEAWNKFCQEVMPDQNITYALRGTFGTVFKRAWDEATQAVREEMIRDGWRQCAEGQGTTQYCGLLEEAVAKEREACAKVCKELVLEHPGRADLTAQQCAAAIRARGNK